MPSIAGCSSAYLHGAPSQEAAAEVLGLPFSTYRRHLSRAHDRIVEVLWAVEVGQLAVAPWRQVSNE